MEQRRRRARLPRLRWILALALVALVVWSYVPRAARRYGYRIVASYPHDPEAYCQGLLFHDGALYESTGRYGESSVRRVDLRTGRVERETRLPYRLFGEGLALHGDRLIQLTWHAGVARLYDAADLKLAGQLTYEGEGWGLTSDGSELILSDGSDRLRFLDPETFAERRSVSVHYAGEPVEALNELEYVDGHVLANVWKSDSIAKIDPRSGEVEAWIDLKGIFDYRVIPDVDAVLNGIAYDKERRRLFVTGKLWPRVYEIELTKKR